MLDIVAVGELLIDLTQTGISDQGIPTFTAYPGGAPANVAVAASRLGAKTAFAGKVGRDSFGTFLRKVMRDNGVEESGLRTDPSLTTMAIVAVSPEGARDFRFVRGADALLRPEEIDPALLENAKIVHFGSVSLSSGSARNATIFAARHAHRTGVLVSYDPNYRAALWEQQEQAVRWMALPLPVVDIIKLSQEELPLLTGTSDLEEGSQRLAEQGISLVLVTLGGEGAFCRWQGDTIQVPGVKVPVADTSGAGDTFLGAVLSRLCRRGEHPLEGLERAELEEILAFANRAAAITCSRRGAIPAMPTAQELEEGASSTENG